MLHFRNRFRICKNRVRSGSPVTPVSACKHLTYKFSLSSRDSPEREQRGISSQVWELLARTGTEMCRFYPIWRFI